MGVVQWRKVEWRSGNGEGGEDGRKRRFVCCKQRSNAAKHVTVVVYGNVKVSWLIYLTIFCILTAICMRAKCGNFSLKTNNFKKSILTPKVEQRGG